jgi:type II secretory pathway component PulF
MGMRPEKALAHLDMIALEWRWMIVAQGLNTDTALSLKRMAQQMRARAKSHVKLVFADGLGNAMLIVVGLVVYWIYSSMMSLVQIHS